MGDKHVRTLAHTMSSRATPYPMHGDAHLDGGAVGGYLDKLKSWLPWQGVPAAAEESQDEEQELPEGWMPGLSQEPGRAAKVAGRAKANPKRGDAALRTVPDDAARGASGPETAAEFAKRMAANRKIVESSEEFKAAQQAVAEATAKLAALQKAPKPDTAAIKAAQSTLEAAQATAAPLVEEASYYRDAALDGETWAGPRGWSASFADMIRGVKASISEYAAKGSTVLSDAFAKLREGASYAFLDPAQPGGVNWAMVIPMVAVAGLGAYGLHRYRASASRERALKAMVDRVAADPGAGAAELAAFIDASPNGACLVLALLRAAAKTDGEAMDMAEMILVESGIMTAAELRGHQLACMSSGDKAHGTRRSAKAGARSGGWA